jgi:hypothetical protein
MTFTDEVTFSLERFESAVPAGYASWAPGTGSTGGCSARPC